MATSLGPVQGTFDVPALILHGAEDPRPVWAVDSLATALPRGDLRIIPRSGHLPWVETPIEVMSSVRNFIQDHVSS